MIVTCILTGVVAVENALLITVLIVCACYFWRKKKSKTLINDIEHLPQDTFPALLADNISHNEVCHINSSISNISYLFYALILMSVVN